MQRNDMIFHSVWTGVLAVLLLAAPDYAFRPEGWRVPMSIFLFAPGVLTAVALTVVSDWFQRLIGKNRQTPASGSEA